MEASAEPRPSTAPAHVGLGSGSGGAESSFDGAGVSVRATATAPVAANPVPGALATDGVEAAATSAVPANPVTHMPTDVMVAGVGEGEAAEAASDVAVGVQQPPRSSLLRELISGGPATPSSLARRASGTRDATATTGTSGGMRPLGEGREEEQIRQDVRLLMQRMRNILPFVILFLLRWAYAHATQIAFFACYTLLLHRLNQELRTQIALKHDQDRKVLASIVVSSLAAVGAALLLDRQVATTQHPLFLSFSSMAMADASSSSSLDAAATSAAAAAAAAATEAAVDAAAETSAGAGAATDDGTAGLDGVGIGAEALLGGMGMSISIDDIIWKILAADVCVRLFFTALKAWVALLPWPLPNWRPTLALSPRVSGPLFRRWLSIFGDKGSQGKKGGHHHHHHHHHRVHSAGGAHAGLSGRVSGDMEGLLAEVEMSISGSGHVAGNGGVGGGGAHSPSRSLGSSSSSVGRRALAGRGDGDCTSVYTRKRRIYCLLEAISLIVRSVLPIPAWFAYYVADKTYGDVFVWMYLTFKCMVLSRHTKAMLGSLRLACSANTLEYGRPASREEVQEAGTGADCPVCYEALDAGRTVVLPCSHFFCEACSSEWLDRERSCPVCRATVQSNFEGWMRMRTGSTSALPCIL